MSEWTGQVDQIFQLFLFDNITINCQRNNSKEIFLSDAFGAEDQIFQSQTRRVINIRLRHTPN